jgi:cyclomaltodextrinase / maltogenic alpha-amylase / neopullulanase
MLYALPGMPVTFQGDECAFLGTGDGPREENRYPMQWPECDRAMVAHYRRLAALKRELDAFASPAIRSMQGEGGLLSFLRGEPGPGELLAVFNGGAGPGSVTVPEGDWTDAVSGEAVRGEVELDRFGWRFLVRR